MSGNDEFNKQYRKIAAAEELLEETALMNLYVELYKKKFRSEPLVDVNKTRIAQMKLIKRTAGAKAYGIVQHYFEMKDPWFVDQAYSLECLIKNMNKVNASYSQRTSTEHLKGKLRVSLYCDCCEKEFDLVCDPQTDFMNKTIRCPECESQNRVPKRVSKEERRKAILKLGAAFPEMSVDSKEDSL